MAISIILFIFANAMTYEELCRRLYHIYEAGEAKAIVRYMLDVRFGLSLADILCGKMDELDPSDYKELEAIMLRLETGEPVQYVIGVADFCGRPFYVEPGVLIPRPETEELCRWIIRSKKRKVKSEKCHALDIGTGSGCIAITLALDIPEAEVSAWDISDDALCIAKDNAKKLNAPVTFEHHDILNISLTSHRSPLTSKYSLIVSNPPYVCNKEKTAMEQNVLDYEPHLALFVPDDDPLRFYRAIAKYAMVALKPEGELYFELNPVYAHETATLLSDMGFQHTELRNDQFGKPRFLKAMRI